MNMNAIESRVEVFGLCFDRIRSNKRMFFVPKPKVGNSLLGRIQFLKITKLNESVKTNFRSCRSTYMSLGRVGQNIARLGRTVKKCVFDRDGDNIASLG